MPIKDLQQAQAQVGRIRLGDQKPTSNGRSRPARLETFRFTTPSEQLAHAVADAYGGTAGRWTPDGRPAEWEVYSTAREINVLVPPHPVTQWYEMWSGQGCVRRCDGEVEQISGESCKCPLDNLERAEKAQSGNACKATTRLKVMLPDLPGIGVWRLDTHGFYAAIELPQTAEFLGAATGQGGYIKARLALEERQVRRPGVGVRQFLVPALHVDASPLALIAGEGVVMGGTPALAAAPAAGAPALPAAPEPPNVDLALALAKQARAATTRDEVAEIWRAASARGLLLVDVGDVDDPDAPVTPLGEYLTEIGKGKATTEAPTGDADQLWAEILAAAPDELTSEQVVMRFKAHAGVPPSDASPEQMQAFLDTLAGVPA